MGKCTFELADIPNFSIEYQGICDFLFSDAMAGIISFWVGNNFTYYHQEPASINNLRVSLMCLALISRVSKNGEIIRLCEQNIANIFENRRYNLARDVIEFLTKIMDNIVDPLVKSLINYIIQPKKGQMECSFLESTPKRKRSYSKLDSILKTLDESGIPHCVDDELRTDSVSLISTDASRLLMFCVICGTQEQTYQKSFNIFFHSTPYICLALIRWSRTVKYCGTVLINDLPNKNLTPISSQNVTENLEEFQSLSQKLAFSGCSHFIHNKCSCLFHEKLNQKVDYLSFGSIFECVLCKNKYNFCIPVNFPVFKIIEQPSRLLLIVQLIEVLIDLKEWKSSHTDQLDINHTSNSNSNLDELVQSFLNSPTDQNNFYLKCCTFLYPMKENKSDFTAKNFCSIIISRGVSALVAYITKLEKQYRNQFPFFPDTKNRHFKVNTQFARFCFYTCGLAPALKACNLPKKDISDLLSPIYFQRLDSLMTIVKILKSDSNVENKSYLLNDKDPFEEFVFSFISLTALIGLNTSFTVKLQEPFKKSLIKLFYFLVLLNVFSAFQSLDHDKMVHTDIPFNGHDVEFLSTFFNTVTLSAPLKENNKIFLYDLYIQIVLPFLRKVSILFFQIFYTKSPLTSPAFLKNQSMHNPYNELKLLLNHFLISSNPAVDQSPYEHGIKELFEKIRSQPSEIHKLMTVERHMKNKILVPLPTHYNDLKENLNFKCSICNCVTKTMCKCLICGLNIPIENSCSCISINPVPPPKLLKEQIVNHSLSCDGTYGIYLKVESPRVIITEWYEARTVEFSLYRGSCGESMYSTQENLTLSEQKYNQLESIYQNDELGSLHYQSTKL
ncbi:hypothetical protein RF11_12574 [Thelohanellus kitauei]|uniref:E3 ubiquitin-protein ligase UBR-like C-terminal domain-containing protein n=1 Tax=Thelohanellus kitauei TaxID=669202 RepID=A0A0C2N518_THEKT|nr:hypothetical protein RF11_12574 [Thelohanellus kitauei]